MSTTIKAGFYIVKQDENENIILFLPKVFGEKNNPVIIYDGKEHGLLVHNQEKNIILDYLNPDIRDPLSKASELTVVEVEENDAIDAYKVAVRHVESIPVDWKNYGLSSWKEVLNSAEKK